MSIKRCAPVGLHSCGASSPLSALRIGKFGKRQSLDLSIIHEVFGENVTLYQVLGIGPSALATEVRQAYIGQGKKALKKGGISINGADRPCELVEVSDDARKRFQAVSRAYEILSTPELRVEYDLYGVVSGLSPPSQTSGSVEWRPYVEQKIFHDELLYEESRSDEHSWTTGSTGAPERQLNVNGKAYQENPPAIFDFVNDCSDTMFCITPLELCSGEVMEYDNGD
ncbi:hypothetical protein ACHAW5_009133 [Stephanodiscus triporus]|uniref:J domain-containing protein n=1 Tax=Stephanodiscus triporus TaxID=2934178 RepID=A0ABD3NHC2_9STRA